MTFPVPDTPEFQPLLDDLAQRSADLEHDLPAFPGPQFDLLAKAGVLGWTIPPEYGGVDASPAVMTDGYIALASACLTTAFVLTQRNGACQRIAGCDNTDLKSKLLPALCTSNTFATVGISHLTTSRQHWKQPAMRVACGDGVSVFDGAAPWVTGAKSADIIVTGGTCDDGRQILAAVPTNLEGIVMHDPPRLMALNASQTGAVEMNHVAVDARWIIAGPVEHVMKMGLGGGTGSLTTSALAAGAAQGSLQRMQVEAANRPDLAEICESLSAELASLLADLKNASLEEPMHPPASSESLRMRSNSLVLRTSQAYLTAAKGAGFVAGHPAERAVREAMFFLVWSCPQPVQTAALREFACIATL